MPNIRVIPINWWPSSSTSSHSLQARTQSQVQVVTRVKLKYVQQPMGKTSSGAGEIIRPSKRIIYDAREAVVSFLSEDVETCVDEFLTEWARVSKMVVVAREVARMAEEVAGKAKKLPLASPGKGKEREEEAQEGIRLLSFDLQTVEFAYEGDYAVSITAKDQLGDGAAFELAFSRSGSNPREEDAMDTEDASQKQKESEGERTNPHEEAERFLQSFIRPARGLAPSIRRLIEVLRDTLPIAVELEEVRLQSRAEHQALAAQAKSRRATVSDTFAKNAGWYRLLYGDLRHALDFRLMTEHRVAVVDGAYSFFAPAKVKEQQTSPGKRDVKLGVTALSTTVSSPPGKNSPMTLISIPGFKDIVKRAMEELLGADEAVGMMVNVDVGIVCECKDVRRVARALHTRAVEALEKAGCFSGGK